MDERYKSRTLEQALGHMVEECGEVLAAVGKSQRWGLESCNPELPEGMQETNRAWLLREMADLQEAIKTVRVWLLDIEQPITTSERVLALRGGIGSVIDYARTQAVSAPHVASVAYRDVAGMLDDVLKDDDSSGIAK